MLLLHCIYSTDVVKETTDRGVFAVTSGFYLIPSIILVLIKLYGRPKRPNTSANLISTTKK